MDILVCVKQVLEPEVKLRLAPSGAALELDDHAERRVSELDLYAVELALRLREAAGGGTIAIASVGPPPAAVAIRRAMGMGAEHGIHVATEPDDDLDAFAVAHCLASVARARSCDLLLAGVQSDDLMQGVVGPTVAALLGLPCATNVVEATWRDGAIEVVRELEAGRRERLAMTLPGALTVQSNPLRPRYPTLSNMLRANRCELKTIPAASLGVPPRRAHTAQLSVPKPTRACEMLTGSPEDKARRLRQMLAERGLL
jgi:electron transfer flavoprotein beta subunit